MDRKFDLYEYFTFRYFVLPDIMRVFYFLGAVLITAVPIIGLYREFSGETLTPTSLFTMVLTLIGGNLIWRVVCELFMLNFRIYESLRQAENSLNVIATTPPSREPMQPQLAIQSQNRLVVPR